MVEIGSDKALPTDSAIKIAKYLDEEEERLTDEQMLVEQQPIENDPGRDFPYEE